MMIMKDCSVFWSFFSRYFYYFYFYSPSPLGPGSLSEAWSYPEADSAAIPWGFYQPANLSTILPHLSDEYVSCLHSPDTASPDRAVSSPFSWSQRQSIRLTLFFPKCSCIVCHRTDDVRIMGCTENQNVPWLCTLRSTPLVAGVWALGSTNALIYSGKNRQRHLALPLEFSQLHGVN